MPTLSKADAAAKVSTNEANRRRVLALAELREMERDLKRGELLNAAAVRDRWVTVGASLRSAVLRLPDACAPLVAAAADAVEARSILMTQCEDILRSLADDLNHAD